MIRLGGNFTEFPGFSRRKSEKPKMFYPIYLFLPKNQRGFVLFLYG